MQLIIKKAHTIGTTFDSIHNDALTRAIKEQLPQVEIKSCYSDFFTDKDGGQYTFDTTEGTGYCRRSFNRLQKGEIKDIHLVITQTSPYTEMSKRLTKVTANKIV